MDTDAWPPRNFRWAAHGRLTHALQGEQITLPLPCTYHARSGSYFDPLQSPGLPDFPWFAPGLPGLPPHPRDFTKVCALQLHFTECVCVFAEAFMAFMEAFMGIHGGIRGGIHGHSWRHS